jgi:hypothetical protein
MSLNPLAVDDRWRNSRSLIPVHAAMSNIPSAPGDEAAPGTPGTGENICPHCGGSGEHGGVPCPVCDGTGKVIEGLAGG